MIRQEYEEWPDDRRSQSYPLTDRSTRTDTSRELEIPREFLLDARLWPNRQSSRVFLRLVRRSADGLYLQLDDLDGPLMDARVSLADLQRQKLVFRQLNNGLRGGWLLWAPGALQNLYDVPTGDYRFSVQAAEFVSSCVSPVLYNGVSALKVEGQLLSGDLTVFGGRGVELDIDAGRLVVDLVGDPYARRDTCGSLQPAYIGALLNPVREVKLVDATTLAESIVTPVAGALLSTVVRQNEDDPDTFHSPGRNGQLLSVIK